ncbi:glycoside hydrolase family 88 protein [Termitidicoccus mucosus]
MYGLAWGINKGHLPADTYLPATTKGWNAMTTKALHPNGFLGYVQGSGSKLSDAQPVTYNMITDFDDFGLGCFLLAGSEVQALAAARSASGDSEVLTTGASKKDRRLRHQTNKSTSCRTLESYFIMKRLPDFAAPAISVSMPAFAADSRSINQAGPLNPVK